MEIEREIIKAYREKMERSDFVNELVDVNFVEKVFANSLIIGGFELARQNYEIRSCKN